MKHKNKKLVISLSIAIPLVLIGTIFWKIATDELFYLCSNFSSGVTKSSVIRQLNTANLSSYTSGSAENGSIIVFSSKLYFVSNQCIIEFDKSEKVVIAGYI